MRMLYLLAASAAIAGAGVDAAAQAPPAVTVAAPLVREIVEDDEFVGRFEPVDEVAVRARVGGYLKSVHFTDGAIVRAGDLLFTIDQRTFRLRLTQSRARLDDGKALAELARLQLRRAEELAQKGNVATATLDTRRREALSAKAQVTDAEAAVRQAEIELEFTEIRAPLSGRIDRRHVSVGNLVNADETVLTTVVSMDPIDFYFDVDERRFLSYSRDARARNATLQDGAGELPVVVRLVDAGQKPVRGHLNFAENRIDGQSGTIRLRARLPNPDFVLYPGLFGRVNVPGSLPYRGILVPDGAVVADQDRQLVWVLDADNVVSGRLVKPGPRLHGYRVIREGLTGDETIIVNGLMRVRPNAKVTPTRIELPLEADTGPVR